MNCLILGYGYCGFYLAHKLLNKGATITTVSRSAKEDLQIPGIKHLQADFTEHLGLNSTFDAIFYLAPPQNDGKQDFRLRRCFEHNHFTCSKLIYFGSSGVYGNHHDRWVSEDSECQISYDRQLRRLDAENFLANHAKEATFKLFLLRVAGIFGPDRIPINSVRKNEAVINPIEAPWSNLIYVEDLIRVCLQLSCTQNTFELINVSDGIPRKMGSMQQEISNIINSGKLPYKALKTLFLDATPMKKEFLLSSKKYQ